MNWEMPWKLSGGSDASHCRQWLAAIAPGSDLERIVVLAY